MGLNSLKLNAINRLWIVAGFVATFVVHKIARFAFVQNADTIVVFFCCLCLFYFADRYKKNDAVVKNIFIGVVVFLAISFLYNLAYSYLHIPEWDFLCFYLFAKAGHSSNSFYNPEVYTRVFNELNLQTLTSKDFTDEVVHVGFWYPAPSMLVFIILAFFDLQTGFIIWQTLIILFLLIDVILLTRLYLFYTKSTYKQSAALIAPLILVFLFPNLTASIFFSQTISLFLLLLLLLILNINNWKAGIFVAVLVIVKPLAAFFFLYFIFFKKWKAVAAAAITGIVIAAITALAFGTQNFITYFTSPPTNRIPDFVYLECSSLFGALRRFQQNNAALISVGNIKIVYYLLSLFFVGSTFFVLRKLHKVSPVLSFIIFIPLALIVYPATLFHYNIMMIPVVLFLFTQKIFSNTTFSLVTVFLLYLIGVYDLFFFNLALWAIIISWPLLLKKIGNKQSVELSLA